MYIFFFSFPSDHSFKQSKILNSFYETSPCIAWVSDQCIISPFKKFYILLLYLYVLISIIVSLKKKSFIIFYRNSFIIEYKWSIKKLYIYIYIYIFSIWISPFCIPKYSKKLTKKPNPKILAFPFLSHRPIAIIFITTGKFE